MEGLEAPYEPGAWEAFEQRLESKPIDDKALLDQVIFSKLANLETPLQSGSWSLMQQMIEAEETADMLDNDAAIDHVVYEKISAFEAPYQNHHWQLMARRLEEEFSLRYKLYKYKIAEAALMMLLVLTIFRFMPLLEEAYQKQPANPSIQQFEAIPKSVNPAQNQQNIPPSSTAPTPVQKNLPLLTTPIAATSATPKSSRFSNRGNLGENTEVPEPGAVNFQNTPIGNTFLPPGKMGEIHSQQLSLPFVDLVAAKNLASQPSATPDTYTGSGSLDLLASLPAMPVQSRFAWEMPQVPQNISLKKQEMRFSIFSNTDVNYVFTPSNKLSVFDTLVATAADTTAASGYGGGILVSWKKGKWEFQTGGVYSFKRYIPNTPIFLFKTVNYYIREDFHGIQLDILQLPLNLQYHFVDSGKWRFYGSGGVSGHFITSSIYEIKYRRIPAFSASAITFPSSPEDNKSIRQEKEFPEGLFDGGNLQDNFYLTANLGFGMERYLSSKWSVFLQPNYQHFIMSEGIGVNNDKFYTFSIYLGTKFNLK